MERLQERSEKKIKTISIFLLSLIFLSTPLAFAEDCVEVDKNYEDEIIMGEGTKIGIDVKSVCDFQSYNIMLVIDASGSMGGDKISDAKDAAKTFSEKLEEAFKAGVVSFDCSSILHQELTDDKSLILSSIDEINAGGNTGIGAGMKEARNQLSGADNPYMVVLSDGKHNCGDPTPSKETSKASEEGIKIYTVGFGSGAEEETLESISDNTGGKYYFSPTGSELEEIYEEIADEIMKDVKNLNITDCFLGSTEFIEESGGNVYVDGDKKCIRWKPSEFLNEGESLYRESKVIFHEYGHKKLNLPGSKVQYTISDSYGSEELPGPFVFIKHRDLNISSLKIPDKVIASSYNPADFEVEFNISNEGDYKVEDEEGKIYHQGGGSELVDFDIEKLNPGDSLTKTFTLNSLDLNQGSNKLCFVLDSDHSLDEASESNNEECREIDVTSNPPESSITINEGDKYTKYNDVTLSLVASSDYNKIKTCKFRNNNSDWEVDPCNPDFFSRSWEKEWELEENTGVRKVYFKVIDTKGKSKVSSDSIVLDYIAPESKICPVGYDYDWTNENVLFNITCDDPQSGCDNIFHNITFSGSNPDDLDYLSEEVDGKSAHVIEEVKCPDNKVCEKRVFFHSVDKAGNKGNETKSDVIKIDKVKPDIECDSCSSKNNSSVVFDPEIEDEGSGLSEFSVFYDSNCKKKICSSTSSTICKYKTEKCDLGFSEFWIQAEDVADNQRVIKGGQFSIKLSDGCTCSYDNECMSGICVDGFCLKPMAPQIFLH